MRKLAKDAAGAFMGLAVMGAAAKDLPAAAQPAVSAAYGAAGLASSSMMLGSAAGVIRNLEKLGKGKYRW